MGLIDIYKDKAGEWRWRLVAPNNRIVADSGEGYTRREDCERALKRVVVILADAMVQYIPGFGTDLKST